jgi:hypothetical protein
MQFKYQTLFTCSVPDGYKTIKDFNEMIATDGRMSVDVLLQTMKLSFESVGVTVDRMDLSNDMNHCDIWLHGEDTMLRVIIRTRPSLVVGDQIFKLEEFDI